MSAYQTARLPYAELENYLFGCDELIAQFSNNPDEHRVSISSIALRCGVSRQTATRWRNEGIPLFAADKLAIRLGVHPLIIWPTFHTEEHLCHT